MIRIGKFEKVRNNIFVASCKNIENAEMCLRDLKLPKRATAGSAGYDFYAPFDIKIEPEKSYTVPTGIRAKMENGWVLAVFPRSGLGFKYQLGLANTVGIIDADFYHSDTDGHIMLKLVNKGEKTVEIEKGKAFAQGIFLPFGITEDDNATETRTGGFGSTDKR